jgi:hypothetical protein
VVAPWVWVSSRSDIPLHRGVFRLVLLQLCTREVGLVSLPSCDANVLKNLDFKMLPIQRNLQGNVISSPTPETVTNVGYL